MKKQYIAAAVFALAASAAQAQTLQLNGLTVAGGCGSGQFAVWVTAAGLTGAEWRLRIAVDAGGHRYSDDEELLPDNMPDGDFDLYLQDVNIHGSQTHPFPLPPATPFTVTLTLHNAANQPLYRSRGVVAPGCDDAGATVTNIASGPWSGPNATPVPTLGHAALGLLGALVGGVGLRARRRKGA